MKMLIHDLCVEPAQLHDLAELHECTCAIETASLQVTVRSTDSSALLRWFQLLVLQGEASCVLPL